MLTSSLLINHWQLAVDKVQMVLVCGLRFYIMWLLSTLYNPVSYNFLHSEGASNCFQGTVLACTSKPLPALFPLPEHTTATSPNPAISVYLRPPTIVTTVLFMGLFAEHTTKTLVLCLYFFILIFTIFLFIPILASHLNSKPLLE